MTQGPTDSRSQPEGAWPAFRGRAPAELRAAFRDRLVAALLALALASLAVRLVLDATPAFGAAPVTRNMLDAVGCCFMPWLWAAVIVGGGQAMARLRTEVAARPAAPVGAAVAAAMAALAAVVAAGLAAAWAGTTLAQALRDPSALQPAALLYGLHVNLGVAAVQLAALGVFMQAAIGRKWIGVLATAVLFGLLSSVSPLGFEHDLLRFGMPPAAYTEMDGWSHRLPRSLTLGAWWTAFCILLLLAAPFLVRRRVAAPGEDRPTLSGRLARTAWAAAVAWFSLGAWIYHNTNVLNAYEPAAERERWTQARNRELREAPAPTLTRLALAVDVHPFERRLDSQGTAVVRNDTGADIPELRLALPRGVRVDDLDVPGVRAGAVAAHSIHRFRLRRPLEPGETLRFGFDLGWTQRGFASGGGGDWLTGNGTVVASELLMPWIGCCPRRAEAGGGAGIDLRVTVSTALDQIALAPGQPGRRWRQEGRAFFEYATARPVSRRFAVHSARYRVLRLAEGDAAIEVYHHPPHAAGAARLADAAARQLAAEGFPYRTFRVVEVPRPVSPAPGPSGTVACPEDVFLVERGVPSMPPLRSNCQRAR